MFKFLHAADLHLDSPLRGLERYADAPAAEIRGATRRALENLVALALEEGVAFVLIAGDLYDGDWRDYNTGLFFASQMGRLRDAGVRVFVAAGNHDAASQLTRSLRPPDNVTVLPTRKPGRIVLEELGVAVCGQGFGSRSVPEDLAAGYPPADPQYFTIGLLHTSLDGREGHAAYAPTSLDVLRSKGYRYWALGHVHRREIVCRDPWVVFAGNTQGRHAREPGPKGCTLVAVDGGEVLEVEERHLDVLRWGDCAVDLAASSSGDEALDNLRGALDVALGEAGGRTLAVRVRFTGASAAHGELRGDPDRWTQEVRALAAGLAPGALWVEKVLFETAHRLELADALSRDDALGGILRAIRDLEADPVLLGAYAAPFADLRKKLPAELFDGRDLRDPTAPDSLGALLEEAKDYLLARLVAGEGR